MQQHQQQWLGVDRADLSGGSGEWRNVQDVLRRAFRGLLEQGAAQQRQIDQLSETVTTLRQQLMIRPSTKEVTKLVDSKLMAVQDRRTSDDAISSLRAELVDIRGSLERRATTRFVEESLRRKLNKADAPLLHRGPLALAAAPPAPAPTFSDLMQVSDELKAKIERAEKKHNDSRLKLGTLVSQAELERTCGALEAQIRGKADKAMVEKDLRRVEDVIAVHEREIVASHLRGPSSHHINAETPRFNHLTQQRHLHEYKMSGGESGTVSATHADTGAGGRMEQLLQAGRVEARQRDEASRLESLEAQASNMQLVVSRLENDVLSMQHMASTVQNHERAIQANASRLDCIGGLELSIDALGEQIQECRGQMGTPFSVPLASVLSNLEDRVTDLDQVLSAQINQQPHGLSHQNQHTHDNCSAQAFQGQVHALSTLIRQIGDELTAKVIVLETGMDSLQEQNQKHLSQCLQPNSALHSTSDQDSVINSLAARLHSLELHCRMSGSGSIKTVQDMLNVVRTLRNMTARLEEKDQKQNEENEKRSKEEQQKVEASNKKREVSIAAAVSESHILEEVIKRVEGCEVADQVQRVRIDALEDSGYRFEHRQLKVNDAFSRHIKALLTAAAATTSSNNSTIPTSQHRPTQQENQQSEKDSGLSEKLGDEGRGYAYNFDKALKGAAKEMQHTNVTQNHGRHNSSMSRREQQRHSSDSDEYSSESDFSRDSGQGYHHHRHRHHRHHRHKGRHNHENLDVESDEETSDFGNEEGKYEHDLEDGNMSSPSSASEAHASPISPHKLHRLLHEFQSAKPTQGLPFTLVHPASRMPMDKGHERRRGKGRGRDSPDEREYRREHKHKHKQKHKHASRRDAPPCKSEDEHKNKGVTAPRRSSDSWTNAVSHKKAQDKKSLHQNLDDSHSHSRTEEGLYPREQWTGHMASSRPHKYT